MTERSLAESEGSDGGGEVSGENEGKQSEIDDEQSIELMLDDIHKAHQLSPEDLER